MNRWKRVSILESLVDEIVEVLPESGFPSVARFVDQAVRDKLKEVKRREVDSAVDG